MFRLWKQLASKVLSFCFNKSGDAGGMSFVGAARWRAQRDGKQRQNFWSLPTPKTLMSPLTFAM